ncbi:MAG: tetratricopeptide repeat protein [Bacteroidota bacterium]
MPISPQQITDWKDQIRNDRLKDAIDSLYTAVQQSNESWLSSWQNTVISLQGDYKINEKLNLSGERSAAEYNTAKSKIRARTLKVIDKIENQEKYSVIENGGGSQVPVWLRFVLPLVGLLAVGYFFLPAGSTDDEQETPPEAEQTLCPEFATDANFKAIVLPYDAASANNRNPSLHNRVNGLLQTFAEDYDLAIESRAVGLDVDEINAQTGYPGGPADADRLGQACGSQLVIWGYTERAGDNRRLTTTEYRFVESPAWQFSEFQLDENMQVATASTFTEIVSSGQLTTGIEDALRLIFGLVARNMQNDKATIALLEDHPVKSYDDQSFVLQQLALAEAYHNAGDDAQAEQAYTDLLDKDSTNITALRNRGTIRYYNQEYQGAAADMTVVLVQKPDDEQARYTRALSNLKSNRLLEAEVDLIRLNNQTQVATPDTERSHSDENDDEKTDPPAEVQMKKISPAQMRVLSREWESSQTQVRGFRDAGQGALQNNSTDVEQLQKGMEAAYQLHDFKLASELAERVVKLEPKNAQAYQIAADALIQTGKKEEAEQVVEQAKDNGVGEKVILHPNLRLQPAVRMQTGTVIQRRVDNR